MRPTVQYAQAQREPTPAETIADRAVKADRQRRREKRAGWIGVLGSFFLVSWLIMLGVGIAHARWIYALPTIDYGTTMLLLGMFYAVLIARALGKEFVRATNARKD